MNPRPVPSEEHTHTQRREKQLEAVTAIWSIYTWGLLLEVRCETRAFSASGVLTYLAVFFFFFKLAALLGFLCPSVSAVQALGAVVVQLISCVWLFATPMDCSTPGLPVLTISRSLLKRVSIESVMPSNHLILCHLLLLLPSIFPQTRVFSDELALLM